MATGAVTPILTGKKWLTNALWSPDGQWIAYGVHDEGSFKIPAHWRHAGRGGPDGRVELAAMSDRDLRHARRRHGPRSRIVVKPAIGARTLTVSGVVKPRDDREQWREELRVEVSVKAGGGWRRVKVIKALHLDDSTFSTSLARPNGDQCRVKVSYAGGWTRSAAKVTKTFAC